MATTIYLDGREVSPYFKGHVILCNKFEDTTNVVEVRNNKFYDWEEGMAYGEVEPDPVLTEFNLPNPAMCYSSVEKYLELTSKNT